MSEFTMDGHPSDIDVSIDDLKPQLLSQLIFERLPGQSCAQLACVSRGWRDIVNDEWLWRQLLRQEYSWELLESPTGGRCGSYRDTYKAWYLHFGHKYGSFAARAVTAWRQLEGALADTDILATLNPPATEADLDLVEAGRPVEEGQPQPPPLPLPLPLRAIYRVRNGQKMPRDHAELPLGLLGGVSFYNFAVCTIIMDCEHLRPPNQEIVTAEGQRCVRFGSSPAGKDIVVQPDGGVYTMIGPGQVSLHRCVPADVVPGACDGVLRWFEEYARRVADACYKASILFADIKDFTTMCQEMHPAQVMAMLNQLYSVFDSMLKEHDVYKMETVGDAYMVACGLKGPADDDGRRKLGGHDANHAVKLLGFAKAMLSACHKVRTPSGQPIEMRVGLHTGPCMSGVLGHRVPRFCLCGDTINTASRLESTGEAMKIHVSQAFHDLVPDEEWQPTGGVFAKGKGILTSYNLKYAGPALTLSAPSVVQPGHIL